MEEKYKNEYALLYLLERVINKKLTSNHLEEELKEILHTRDNIIKDRFYNLINNSIIMDMNQKMTYKELFQKIANEFNEQLNLSSEEIIALFNEREEESSTALSSFLAIPHIVIDGKNMFKMLIIRNSAGIKFSEKYDSIKSIFILIGTRDERQFHLQSLSAIAQITQNPDFEKLWLNARNEKNIRDICLLSNRKIVK